MAMRHYTRDELLHLRNSPLITKPDNLPAIEQWLEYVYVDRDSKEKLRIPHSEAQQQTQNATQNKRQPHRQTPGEASPMGNFGAGSSRPSLLATRSHGGSRTGDDVSHGPPKTVFASSRKVHTLADGGEKSGDGEEQDGPRSRFFGDKSNRKSANEKDGAQERDWTRRGFGTGEEKPDSRWGRREKETDGEKRNGYGERHDPRWGEKRHNGERQGGWRDRERDRREPEWNRDGRPEKEPEWMDDPAPPNAEDDLRTMGMPRNQEQFQKWKEAMSGKKSQAEAPPPEPEPAPAPKPAAAPLKLDGFAEKAFGGWGEQKPLVSTPEGAPVSAKGATAKGKGSRFASMFKESQPKDEPAPPPIPETSTQNIANQMANGAAEDEAGFKRILQMLGNTTVSQPAATPEGPSSPQPKTSSNGTVKKSRFTGFFDQAGPKSPERVQSPPVQMAPRQTEGMFSASRNMQQDGDSVFGGAPETRYNGQGRVPMPNMASPEPPPGLQQRPQSGRMNDIFLEQPPSRGAGTPEVGIQNLLAAQQCAQRPQGQDKNSEFLLGLLQSKGPSRPPSQQTRPDNFSLWLDQPAGGVPEPHAPKPRMPPPPGLFEDQLLRNHPQDHQRQDTHQPMFGNDLPQRRQSHRAAPSMPPGFYDEQSMFMHQQQQARRGYEDPQQPLHQQQQPGRRMSGHPSLPQMQIPPGIPPQQQFGGGPPPPDFLQSPTGGPSPGFQAMGRRPPGLGGNANAFGGPQQQQPQPQPQMQGPPGFGGAGGQGWQSPPGMPPGLFGPGPGGAAPGMPPGFGGMRGPGDGMAVGAGGGRGRGFEGVYEGMGAGRR